MGSYMYMYLASHSDAVFYTASLQSYLLFHLYSSLLFVPVGCLPRFLVSFLSFLNLVEQFSLYFYLLCFFCILPFSSLSHTNIY